MQWRRHDFRMMGRRRDHCEKIFLGKIAIISLR